MSFPVSETTQKILRNFASFNTGLLLNEGQAQHTHLKSKSILAVAQLPEAWPKQTGIYNMNEFLGVLSTFKSPSIEFAEDRFTIFDPANPDLSTEYPMADPTVIGATNQAEFPHDEPKVEFTVTQDEFNSLKKTAALMSLLVVQVTVKKGVVTLAASGETTAKAWKRVIPADRVKVADASFDKTVKFSVEHIVLLLDGEYTIQLADWPYGYFGHKTMPVGYYIAQQKKKA